MNITKKTETDSQIQREQTSGYQWVEGEGEARRKRGL